MLRIVLATLNARYSHASLGCGNLLANLGPYRPLATLREFTIEQQTLAIVEQLLAEEQTPLTPTPIGFWGLHLNIVETTQVVALLRTLRPELRIVIGGPEVSFEYEDTEIFRLCDHLVIGEGDVAFRELVADLSAGKPRESRARRASRYHGAASSLRRIQRHRSARAHALRRGIARLPISVRILSLFAG